MCLRSLDSLQSLTDALSSAGPTIPKPDVWTVPPAAKWSGCGNSKPGVHKDNDNDNEEEDDSDLPKVESPKEWEIQWNNKRQKIKDRIARRRQEKYCVGGCTNDQSADEEFGHLWWPRGDVPSGSDSEPDEKEDDEQLRVCFVRPPEDTNYDSIMKDEYDEEDEEAEIYEKYDSGNEGDDEDDRHPKKGRCRVLCGLMEGLVCAAETPIGPVTADITTPAALDSAVLAPQTIPAPQDSGLLNSYLPAIVPSFISSLLPTRQPEIAVSTSAGLLSAPHPSQNGVLTSQPIGVPFPDTPNAKLGFVVTRSQPVVFEPIPTFPLVENVSLPTSGTEPAVVTETSLVAASTVYETKKAPIPPSLLCPINGTEAYLGTETAPVAAPTVCMQTEEAHLPENVDCFPNGTETVCVPETTPVAAPTVTKTEEAVREKVNATTPPRFNNLSNYRVPRRHRIPPMRPRLTPNPYRYRIQKSPVEEPKPESEYFDVDQDLRNCGLEKYYGQDGTPKYRYIKPAVVKPAVVRPTPLKRKRGAKDVEVQQTDTRAPKKLNASMAESWRDMVKPAVIVRPTPLKRKRDDEVEEVQQNHTKRSLVDTRAAKRANLRGEESWGLLKMAMKKVKSGWRFVMGLKARIWR
ncbi:Protein of unknown function [Pyronema omphalodes CBS 100304]|uniref:Uncharacterized protein n=1 Tax=Pyronema omphalodes (strain CBS 100304) TaxID=1076935 RepID=U4LA84_PYROM|nr:Protein of unknown function [Pyronema omphalodes CBS 100304]